MNGDGKLEVFADPPEPSLHYWCRLNLVAALTKRDSFSGTRNSEMTVSFCENFAAGLL